MTYEEKLRQVGLFGLKRGWLEDISLLPAAASQRA